MYQLGLIGKRLDYSFSVNYFQQKFQTEKLHNWQYLNYEIDNIDKINTIWSIDNLKGLNITIPYKQAIIPYLDEIRGVAKDLMVVNTVVLKNDKKIGYNTDYIGLKQCVEKHVPRYAPKAMIIGTGATAKTAAYVLYELGIECIYITRNENITPNTYTYTQAKELKLVTHYPIIIQTTPVGTYPFIDEKPDISYELLTPAHLLVDVIYNPSPSSFLIEGIKQGASTISGNEMLLKQAEASWQVWQASI